MKELMITDDRGFQVIKALLDVKGEDWCYNLKYPMVVYLKEISLIEEKKEKADEPEG